MFDLVGLLSYSLSVTDTLAQVGSPPGINMENFLEYTPIQRQLISHFLTLGVSAMACGFVYFLATIKRSAPRYQPSSVFSAVVMVSAFFILFRQLNG